MKRTPLLLGPLAPPGFQVRRSGVRWLREDGQLCNAGDSVAFCSISLHPVAYQPRQPQPFREESRDLQVVFSTRVAGRLHHASESRSGGFADQLEATFPWMANFVIGHIEHPGGVASIEPDCALELLMIAGRKTYELAEDRTGLMSGYHDRCRAWRINDEGEFGTVLSMGTCELDEVIRGEKKAFLETFSRLAGPAHIVSCPDTALVFTARIIRELIRRTPEDSAALANDLSKALAGGSGALAPADWLFAGAVLQALQRSPLTDSQDLLSRSQLRRADRPHAVVLSMNSDLHPGLEHRRLGYAFRCHAFRYRYAGPAFIRWLRENFVELPYDIHRIRQDYLELFGAIREFAPTAHILVLNIMSTSGAENIQAYDGFDSPLGNSILTVRAKELNLMLHDLARDTGIAIVDADAIAADLGGGFCIPDGIHHNGRMQVELRREIIHILHARKVPGFVPRFD